jgi:nucleoside-diphosphate-sugar epimerase
MQVTGTYRTSHAVSEQVRALGGDLNLRQVDLADESAFAKLPKSIDAVVHVAGVSIAAGVSNDDLIRCNVVGTGNVLRYALAAGAARIIYTSSLSIHGRVGVPVVDETTPILDADLYGTSKYFGERLLAAEADRLSCIAIRLPGVLGRGAHRAWIPTLLERIRAGKEISLYNPHAPFNNAAHVDDIGRFCINLLGGHWTGFAATPLAATGMITVREVVDRLVAATGMRVAVTVRTAPQPGFVVSSDRAIQGFGYDPMEIGHMVDRYAAEG